MKDDIWKRDEIESPCVKLCMIHPEEGICVGCHRTIDEIAVWSRLTPEARREVMAQLPSRAPRLARRRGGHSGRLGG
ncbi:DUF1289 domain-containing protein [Cereibacter sphaeroides]|uniref:DUF1289 domain-containing protein n=1 Tax=Rhodobacterales TaxID=204455 RepID=UPI000BBEB3B2|nr:MULTISPECIES: DUF1289 domain-containing protein [Paracoccaceae]MCE6953216.1 DUF1289 domain-containing protein [Cereibacter sphaeroides]MCE6961683.1 DUF1289 domain-containing protein [Cereibacter sphaeroides]MCE6970459.1 DUF1289 domain-containing protein [Cereibacter sphaeroides]MCE6975033.1 DUF1289 domain-containing protein [Cereibacter sphaeroides]